MLRRLTRIIPWLACVGSAAAAVAPPPPTPDDGTTFHLFVGDQYTYDDNLYRLAESVSAVASTRSPEATRADSYNTVSAGGIGQWYVGRQNVDFSLRADYSRFVHNTALDNTGGDAQVVWNWQVGSPFSGQVGAEFNRALASFAETRYLGRDLVDYKNYFGKGTFQLGPHWAIIGGVREMDITHGAAVAAFNNFKNRSGNAGLQFTTGVSDIFGLEYQYAKGLYPSNFVFDNVPFDRDFKEDIYRGTITYAITEKLNVDAYAGYLKHTLSSQNFFSGSTFGDFSGNVWRVTLNWLPTEKTQLAFAGWHELHAYLASETDYFVSKGFSITPTWRPTERISVAFVASREDQDYVAAQTVTGAVPSSLAPARFDRVTAEQVSVFYIPRQRWTLNLFLRNERRSSNQADIAFSDKSGNASFTYKFW
ncbi:MAG TPA: hypothetical protein VKP66_11585 [Steroidobacteraceae bacterium]|nr:hypothetical protein [Steroidobacteraceae bacterium]